MALLFRHRLTVRFRDCDPLGHVNHAVYLTYLEQARFTLWRRQLGFVVRTSGGTRVAPAAPGLILARADIDYRAQVRYGDELEVRLSLESIGRTSFTYRVRNHRRGHRSRRRDGPDRARAFRLRAREARADRPRAARAPRASGG